MASDFIGALARLLGNPRGMEGVKRDVLRASFQAAVTEIAEAILAQQQGEPAPLPDDPVAATDVATRAQENAAAREVDRLNGMLPSDKVEHVAGYLARIHALRARLAAAERERDRFKQDYEDALGLHLKTANHAAVVCGDHWHGLSGEPVDGSEGCPWCIAAQRADTAGGGDDA